MFCEFSIKIAQIPYLIFLFLIFFSVCPNIFPELYAAALLFLKYLALISVFLERSAIVS